MAMMVIDPKYGIGDTVYLITDKEQLPRMIYCYLVYKADILYKCVSGTIASEHYDFELSDTKNILADA